MSDFAQITRGASAFSAIIAAGGPAAQNVKLASGILVGVDFGNIVAAASFLRLYDIYSFSSAINPTPGFSPTIAQLQAATPKMRFYAPQATNIVWSAPSVDAGVAFIGGIWAQVSGASPDNDTTNVGANGCFLNIKFI